MIIPTNLVTTTLREYFHTTEIPGLMDSILFLKLHHIIYFFIYFLMKKYIIWWSSTQGLVRTLWRKKGQHLRRCEALLPWATSTCWRWRTALAFSMNYALIKQIYCLLLRNYARFMMKKLVKEKYHRWQHAHYLVVGTHEEGGGKRT